MFAAGVQQIDPSVRLRFYMHEICELIMLLLRTTKDLCLQSIQHVEIE